MKAKDITTPGDYEVKNFRGLRKVRLVRIVKVDERVSYGGRDVAGHMSTNTYVLAESGSRYTLQQVIRPWADAAGEHAAAEKVEQEGERARSDLEAAFRRVGLVVDVDESRGSLLTRFTREQAASLISVLHGAR